MTQKNDGTAAQDEFELRISARPNTYVWRMRDKKDLMGLNKNKKIAAFASPSDFLVGEPGRIFYAEVKSTISDRFDYSGIRPAQRSAATICAAIGAPFWFFVYIIPLRQWFELSAEQFAADIRSKKKSRRHDELTPCSFF